MDNARALVADELARTSRDAHPALLRASPPAPISVIVPPAPGSALARAYEELEQEKLALVDELGQVHMACVVAELEDVLAAMARLPGPAADRAELAQQEREQEREQERLHKAWQADIRALINQKLCIG